MNYSKIKYNDIANGEGVRTSLFVSGCRNHCKGCFQPETWDFYYGIPFSDQIKNDIIESLKPNYIQGLSILGGDPFEPENVIELYPFVEDIKIKYPQKDIWCYTGYQYENIIFDKTLRLLLKNINILVDGRFILEQKDISLQFRGSKNQRIIDVQKSIKEDKIVIWNE